MRLLKSHYDKIVLLLSVLAVIVSVLVGLLSGEEDERGGWSGSDSAFYFDTDNAGNVTLELGKENGLMPGQSVTFVSKEDESISKTIPIKGIVLERRGTYALTYDGSKKITGTLMINDDLTLDRDWKKTRVELAIQSDEGRALVSLAQLDSIHGSRVLLFDPTIDEFDPDEWFLSLYQALPLPPSDGNETKADRARWTKPSDEMEDSIYDLFTPPVIYLVDGNLTTTLPEKEVVVTEKTEEFGLSLDAIDNKPYRFKMSGWIGKVPIFDDLDPLVSQRRQNKRNRMEIGIPYRENLTGKPGTSSLIRTTEEDQSKLLQVTYFTIQQVRDKKSGGVRSVGRAMVKDFRMGGKTFEINSMMDEVFAGEIEIKMTYRLEGANEPTNLSDKDTGKVLEFNGRRYTIKEINLDDKWVLVEKLGPGPSDKTTLRLSLP